MATSTRDVSLGTTGPSSTPITVVSTDCHVGPSLRGNLRAYCESRHLDDYDAYVREIDQVEAELAAAKASQLGGIHTDRGDLAHASAQTIVRNVELNTLAEETIAAQVRAANHPALQDPYARIRDLDADGVAGEVVFNGGQNGEGMPFMYTGFNRAVQDTLSRRMEAHRQWQRGFVAQPIESPLSAVGVRIYNRWLADFLSVEPERHVGLMQLPIWDIDATIAELHWGREHGLKGVNFPAPRQGLVPYNDPSYEPMWSALEELDLALATHAGAGDIPLGISGPAGYPLLAIETAWLGRRAVWQMIFSGVFERHPNLRLALAEQGVQWIPEMLREMDSLYAFGPMASMREFIPEPPSTYWFRNCFIAASFAARFEVEQRHLIGGPDKIMWGSDFPHMEGTWPNTLASLRTTFHDVPEDEVRRMLGGSAIDVFGFDRVVLDDVAARIGPRPEDLDQPAGEIPTFPGMGFRELGLWS